MILKAISEKSIPIYGDGLNVRDWLFVEDHVDAILLVIKDGVIGSKYCIGGYGEKTNKEVVGTICNILNEIRHLAWDMGYGFDLKVSRITGIATIFGSFVLAILFYFIGKNII